MKHWLFKSYTKWVKRFVNSSTKKPAEILHEIENNMCEALAIAK